MPKGIRIVCISDTHNATPPVEEGDILLHAGDLSNGGTLLELQKQLDWIASLPHKHKVVVGGNHDMLLDPNFVAARGLRFKPGGTADELDWHDIHYLCNESLELNLPQGEVRIYGSPNTPAPRGIKGAFQYDNDEDPWTDTIPEGTDLLLVHGPPKGYLDQGGKGCPHLLREIHRVKPKMVVFGHFHQGRGTQIVSLAEKVEEPAAAERMDPEHPRSSFVGSIRRRLLQAFSSHQAPSPTKPSIVTSEPELEHEKVTMVNAAVHFFPDPYEAAKQETKEGYVVYL